MKERNCRIDLFLEQSLYLLSLLMLMMAWRWWTKLWHVLILFVRTRWKCSFHMLQQRFKLWLRSSVALTVCSLLHARSSERCMWVSLSLSVRAYVNQPLLQVHLNQQGCIHVKQSTTEHFTKGRMRGFAQRLNSGPARVGTAQVTSTGANRASLRWQSYSWSNASPHYPPGNAS